jgi:hypothetical protein
MTAATGASGEQPYLRRILAEFRSMAHDHGVVIVLITLTHLLTNTAFTASAEFVARIIYFGPGADPRAFGLICNAPLTASMAVLIATIAIGKTGHREVINKQFFINWVIVTILFGWANTYTWFTNDALGWRFAPIFIYYPPITDWFDLSVLIQRIPTLINIAITTIAMISVPIMILRRQPLFRSKVLKALALVAASVTFFLVLDGLYRSFIDSLNLYQNWLHFRGFNPYGIGNDQMVVDLISLPVSLPAWIVTTMLSTAAVKVAQEQRRAELAQKAAQNL